MIASGAKVFYRAFRFRAEGLVLGLCVWHLLDVEEIRPALKERHQSVQQVLHASTDTVSGLGFREHGLARF